MKPFTIKYGCKVGDYYHTIINRPQNRDKALVKDKFISLNLTIAQFSKAKRTIYLELK